MEEAGSSDAMIPLVENEDYYLDHGLMVLTARFHLRRGYCCEQGCRHCPYGDVVKRTEESDDPRKHTKLH
jgi:hypothetical protein